MRLCIRWMRFTVLAALIVLAVRPATAQEREYYISGEVVNVSKQPLAGVAIELRERGSRRAYRITTDSRGNYKLVGLPHGVYDVKATKSGYKERTFEWDLHEPQDRLHKVHFDPLILLSETQVTEIKRDTKLKSELTDATSLIQKGDLDGALRALADMLSEKPDDANALYLTGVCRLQKGELDAAASALEKVVELTPDFASARVQLAACYERRGEKERALATYDAALKLDPENLMALFNAGVLRYNAGDADGAFPYFEKAARIKPDDDRALEMAGYCRLQALKYGEALAYLERARALITDLQRAATLDEILKELRPRVPKTPTPGNGG
jgi:tetratricopeptide (TPR) repeat protein